MRVETRAHHETVPQGRCRPRRSTWSRRRVSASPGTSAGASFPTSRCQGPFGDVPGKTTSISSFSSNPWTDSPSRVAFMKTRTPESRPSFTRLPGIPSSFTSTGRSGTSRTNLVVAARDPHLVEGFRRHRHKCHTKGIHRDRCRIAELEAAQDPLGRVKTVAPPTWAPGPGASSPMEPSSFTR